MVLELLVGWLRHNKLVGGGIEVEAGVRGEMNGGGRDGREEPNAETVVELEQMSRRLIVIPSD
jgi:hypothetical protein